MDKQICILLNFTRRTNSVAEKILFHAVLNISEHKPKGNTRRIAKPDQKNK